MSNVYFGIDIGTGNCSVAYVVDDPRQRTQQLVDVRTVSIAVDENDTSESNRLPSIVGKNWSAVKSSRPLFGWEFHHGFFKKRRTAKLLRRGVDYFSSVKSDMGTHKVYPRSALKGLQTPAQVTAFILSRLAEAVLFKFPKYDVRTSHVTVTVPASFSALARTETLHALGDAGFDTTRIELIDEPVAALLDLLNSSDAAQFLTAEFRNVLVFDYGAGTCDLSLVKARFNANSASGLEVINLAISPYRQLGGDDIDRAVMREVVWPLIATEQQRARISTAEERRVEDTLTFTVARTLKERLCRKVATQLQEDKGTEVLSAGTIFETCPLECRFDIDGLDRQTPTQFKMTAKQFAALMEPFVQMPDDNREDVRSLLGPVFETLRRAELKPHELDVIVLHGGSSQNPYVETMLRERISGRPDLFGSIEIAKTPDRVASVARGAALASYWRKARSVEIVTPIIADDLGIVVIDGSPKCLLKAGQSVPYPSEDEVEEVTSDEFVVPSDSLPELLIPVYTGRMDDPIIAGTIKVPIPRHTSAGAPVLIKVNVTRNKILNWWFSINSEPFEKAESIDDPWSRRAPSGNERTLLEHRKQMREQLDENGEVPLASLLDEASLLRKAGRSNEAFNAVDDLLDDHQSWAEALNLKGLLYHEIGSNEAAIDAFKRASEADTTNPVFVGNYGAQLIDNGKVQPGIAALRRALSMDANLTYAYEFLAQALRSQGDEEGAQRELRRGVTVAQRSVDAAPFDPYSWMRMHALRNMLGDYDQADAALRTARELERNRFYGGDSSAIIASRFGKKSWQDVES
jgi:molecular chaperone DnaK